MSIPGRFTSATLSTTCPFWHRVFSAAAPITIQQLARTVPSAHLALHTYSVRALWAQHTCPYQRLEAYVQYYYHLPLQGSPEWLADKLAAQLTIGAVPTLGGSDVDTLLGFNPYQTKRDLLANRLGLAPFTGNRATRWGNVCEEITSMLCEELFDCTTYETGSLPGYTYRGVTIQRYSPDRIGVVRHSRIAAYLDRAQAFSFEKKCVGLAADPIPRATEYTVLFEYKDPLSRVPSGIVPKQYTGQMQLGLATIPADFAVFVDSMIRKCSRAQFGVPESYCRYYHPDARIAPETTAAPIFAGFIGFYYTREPGSVDTAKVLAARAEFPAAIRKIVSCRTNTLAQPDDTSTQHANTTVQYAVARAAVNACIAAGVPTQLCNVRDVADSVYPCTLEDAAIQAVIAGATMPIEDYGCLESVDDVFESVVSEKFKPHGCRAYYSPFFKPPPIDDPMYGVSARMWLDAAVQNFVTYCAEHNHVATGYMPYKMYQITIAPMPRYPGFMDTVAPLLERTYDELRELTVAEDRAAALEALYPAPKRRPREVEYTYSHVTAIIADTTWDDVE